LLSASDITEPICVTLLVLGGTKLQYATLLVVHVGANCQGAGV